ncbi:MAG: COG1615 family transporter, partial [Calothrix sp. SM1_7_51]|nr:COG1615 family transporter [Calothrix sp. SM1_7_51]
MLEFIINVSFKKEKSVFRRRSFQILLFCLGFLLILDLLSRLVAEIIWFHNVGYLQAFLFKLITQGILWIVVSGVTAWYLLKNIFLAQRQKYPHPNLDKAQQERSKEINKGINKEINKSFFPDSLYSISTNLSTKTKPVKYLKFRWLILIVFSLSLLLTLFLAHYGQIAIYYWNSDIKQVSITSITPALFQPEEIWRQGQQIISKVWYVGLVLGVASALLIYPQFLLNLFAILLSIA